MSAYLLAKLPFGLLCWRTTRGSADDKWKWADGELLRGTYDMQTAFRSGGHIPMLAAPMLAALVLSPNTRWNSPAVGGTQLPMF